MKRFLLLALTAGLLSTIAAKAESYWMVLENSWKDFASMEKIEMLKMEQCKEQGERFISKNLRLNTNKQSKRYLCLIGE